MIAIPRFELRESAALSARLGKPLHSPAPIPMEAAGQSYGYILYRKGIEKAFRGPLEIAEAQITR